MLSIVLAVLSVALFVVILVYVIQEMKTSRLINERQVIIDSLIITSIEFKYDLKVTNINYLN